MPYSVFLCCSQWRVAEYTQDALFSYQYGIATLQVHWLCCLVGQQDGRNAGMLLTVRVSAGNWTTLAHPVSIQCTDLCVTLRNTLCICNLLVLSLDILENYCTLYSFSVRRIAKCGVYLLYVCLSVCLSMYLSAWNSAAYTGRTFVKFDIWVF